MADKIVFDSERFEKRQKLKRWLIPAAALLIVILIAAVIALIVRGSRGSSVSGGTDTDYPYTWAAGKDGSILLEIDRSAAPGYRWIAAEGETQMSVSEQQDDAAGKTRFTLSPREEGRSVLTFRLCRPGDETDRIYVISALAETTVSGRSMRSALLSVSGKPLQGTVRGGEGTDFPYLLYTDADGDLVLVVTDNRPVPEEEEVDVEAEAEVEVEVEVEEEAEETTDEPEDSSEKKDEGWTCVSENEAVAEVLGVIVRENTAAAYLRAGSEPGSVLVRMADSVSGTEIVLELEADGSDALILLDHSLHMTDIG